MFQYAFGRVLSIKNNTDLAFNIEAYEDKSERPFSGGFAIRTYDLDVFNVKARIAKKNEIPFLYRMYFKGSLMTLIDAVRRRVFKLKSQEIYAKRFNPKMLLLGKNSYVDGFFQSPKYFEGYEDILREDFKLKQEPALNIKNLYKEISGCNSLCIHVRRGDFIGNKEHEVVDNDYYKKAMIIMEKEVLIDKIYVFSDDIDWCKENMSFNHPVFFVDNSLSGQKGEGHMYLMSGCKNFIIPNSTFSWWGIWLSSNENKKVVAPKIWSKDPYADVSDIILNEWIKI
jgi:hypothetical protein